MRQEAAEAQRYVLDMCVGLRDAEWRMYTTDVFLYGGMLLTSIDQSELSRGRVGEALISELGTFLLELGNNFLSARKKYCSPKIAADEKLI
jgi:hypothetical protein